MEKTTRNIGFLGLGEIGKAIAVQYDAFVEQGTCRIFGKTLEYDDFANNRARHPEFELDVLHVCIPWMEEFVPDVLEVIRMYAPNGLVIIHSTVPPGTTKQIQEVHTFTVHSPVRGKHPDLSDGVRTFVKYIGSDHPGAARLASDEFTALGLKVQVFYRSRTTELMKLLDTTYYAHCIAFHDYARRLCEKEGVSFDQVMTEANNSYNAGYMALGHPEYVRPILTPPHGPIGGHCLVPNARLLREQYGPEPLIDDILRLGKPVATADDFVPPPPAV